MIFFKQKETGAEAKELGQESLPRRYWVYCLRGKMISTTFEKIHHSAYDSAMTLNIYWSC